MPQAGALAFRGYVATPCAEYPVAYCYATNLADTSGWNCDIDVRLCLEDRAESIRSSQNQHDSLTYTDCFPAARPLH